MLIALEGLDRTGKSSLAARLIQAADFPLTYTREPGGTPTGLLCRELLLGSDAPVQFTPLGTLLLFLVDRAEHVPAIRRELAGGTSVLTDRWSGSTLAYQAAQGFPLPMLQALDEMVRQGLQADLTLLLDASPAALALRQGPNTVAFPMDLAVSDTIRANYLSLAAADPSWVILDALADPDQVFDDAMRHVRDARRAWETRRAS